MVLLPRRTIRPPLLRALRTIVRNNIAKIIRTRSSAAALHNTWLIVNTQMGSRLPISGIRREYRNDVVHPAVNTTSIIICLEPRYDSVGNDQF